MPTIFTKAFLANAAERAISTVAEAEIAVLTVILPAHGGDFSKLTPSEWLWVPLVAGLLAVLKAIVAGSAAGGPTASLARSVAKRQIAGAKALD